MVDLAKMDEAPHKLDRMHMNGVLEDIFILKTGHNEKYNNDWTLYKFKVGEMDFSGFGNNDNDPYCHFKAGDNVEVEYIQENGFFNAKGIKEYDPVKAAESEKLYKEYTDKQTAVINILSQGLFSGEFEIDGELYEIVLRKKQ